MEKIKQYETIILKVLNNQIVEVAGSDVQDYIIVDKEKRHYQLLRMGWDTPDIYINKVIIHFRIAENSKIWLLKNNTEAPLTVELLQENIPNSDIVLGFHPERYRAFTEFAVA